MIDAKAFHWRLKLLRTFVIVARGPPEDEEAAVRLGEAILAPKRGRDPMYHGSAPFTVNTVLQSIFSQSPFCSQLF
jgi:hypothetical protein